MSDAFRTIAYIKDEELSYCDFLAVIPNHAMKPWRVAITHELVSMLPDAVRAGVNVVRPPRLTLDAVCAYHSPAYLHQLRVHSRACWNWEASATHVAYTTDCPPVEGVVEYSLGVAAATLHGAALLNGGRARVAVNWAGGLHHAKCGECAGFCYVNDPVLGILELLKAHDRVLYIDLDIHHGDGVEEAFLACSRVYTLSLHKHNGRFFPGSGALNDVGSSNGLHCTLNIPLPDGTDDHTYTSVFRYALHRVANAFKPSAIVLQCGADSLAGDRVGTFNLSSVAHATCVLLVKHLNLPLLVLGGGGYNVENVAKCWAYETAMLALHTDYPGTELELFSPYTTIKSTPALDWLFSDTASTYHVPSQYFKVSNSIDLDTIELLMAHILHQTDQLLGQ